MSTFVASQPTENKENHTTISEDGQDSDYRGGRRSRASREQLAILEESFKTNSQPSAKARELLAKKLNMPERTVQIWFQNRRAKIKLGQRKHHLALKEEALRQHCLAAYSGRPSVLPPQVARNIMTPDLPQTNIFQSTASVTSPMVNPSNFSPYPNSSPFFTNNNNNNTTFNGYSSNFNTPVAQNLPVFEESSQQANSKNPVFPCSILTIGTWRRMPLGNDELVCSFSVETNQMSWVIGDKLTKFRICFPFTIIKSISLAFIDSIYAELSIEINGTPSFSTLNADKVWTPCGDFTENHQASVINKHVITGDAQSLRIQLLKLLEVCSRLVALTEIKPTTSATNTFNPSKLSVLPNHANPLGVPMEDVQSQHHQQQQHLTPNPNNFSFNNTHNNTNNYEDNKKVIEDMNYIAALSAHATPIIDQTNCFSPNVTPHFDMNGFNYGEFNQFNQFNDFQHPFSLQQSGNNEAFQNVTINQVENINSNHVSTNNNDKDNNNNLVEGNGVKGCN